MPVDEFHLSVLERLARIIGGAYTGTEITDLLRRAGFETIRHDSGTKWRFLYSAFEDMQGRFGPEGILKVLTVACSPQETLNRPDVRADMNECLAFSGLEIGKDGEVRRVERAQSPRGGDGPLFDQRGYHELVVEHAREKFLRGDYFGAVGDCCREFEGHVRKMSGLELSGRKLMHKALNPKAGMIGSLESSLPDATNASRDGAQEGIMHMAMGIMAGPRNSTAHESRGSFPINRADALNTLTVLSHILAQLEKAGWEPRSASDNGGVSGSREPSPTGQASYGHARESAGEVNASPQAKIPTHSTRYNVTDPRKHAESHGGRARLNSDTEDVDMPVLAWTRAGGGLGEGTVTVLGGGLVRVRVVNAGRASAMSVTGDITHMLSVNGSAFSEIGREQQAWGTLLPNAEMEVRVWVPKEAMGTIEGRRGEYRADILLEYRSLDETGHRRQMSVRYDGKRTTVRDVKG